MKKVTRDAFLYFAPQGTPGDFAQCRSCCWWAPDGDCAVLGIKVAAGDTCGLYVPGVYDGAKPDKHLSVVEAGLVRGEVRCQHCRYGGERCALYDKINAAMPDDFALDSRIDAHGCCNAFERGR